MTRYVIVLLFCVATAALAVDKPLTVEEYATMPEISGIRFSPDGTRVAYVVTRANFARSLYEGEIHVINTDGANDIQLTGSGGSSTHPRWSPDGRRIAFLSDRTGRMSIYVIDLRGGESSMLTDEPTPIRDFDWSPDNRTIVFTRPDEAGPRDEPMVIGQNKRFARLYAIDTETRAVKQLTAGSFSVGSFSISPDGTSIAFDRSPGNTLDDLYRTDLYTMAIGGGDPKPLVRRAGIDRTPLFSPDGKSVAFISGGGVHDWVRENALHVVNVADGTSHLVSGDFGRSPQNFAWSPDSRTIWFDGVWNTTSQIFRVDTGAHGFANISNVEGVIDPTAFDPKRGMAAFVYESLTEPPELYVSPLAKFTPRRLTNINARYRNRAIGQTRLIRWKNPKDGLEIEGLLTLPIGYQPGKRVPLITFAHGGPASHFDQAFLGYLSYIYPVHVFASNGMAVLRPNPRGTGGYGQAFRQANRNDWGGGDWADINAGIDKLIADGIADPAHLGFMGWSYGGFMSSWAEGHSDRLQAISIGAPVVDLLSFHGTTDIREFIPFYFGPAPAEAAQLEEMRHAPLSLDLLREHSPLWHLKPTKAAILIQHDDGDERVPLSQGTMLYRMLDELGANVTMVVYPHEPVHTPRNPKNRIDAGRRNVEFMQKYVLGERESRPQEQAVAAGSSTSPRGTRGDCGRDGRSPHRSLDLEHRIPVARRHARAEVFLEYGIGELRAALALGVVRVRIPSVDADDLRPSPVEILPRILQGEDDETAGIGLRFAREWIRRDDRVPLLRRTEEEIDRESETLLRLLLQGALGRLAAEHHVSAVEQRLHAFEFAEHLAQVRHRDGVLAGEIDGPKQRHVHDHVLTASAIVITSPITITAIRTNLRPNLRASCAPT